MSKVDDISILETIKQDNLVLFSSYIAGRENLSFGRFPLLTICYMYEARKIIRKYRNTLCVIKKYSVVTEPYELYKKFREYAHKALRLYNDEAKIVSPLEMLAIMKKDSLVKRYYKKFYTDENIKKNIRDIYKLSAIKCNTGSNISVGYRPLSVTCRRLYRWSMLISLSFVILLSLVYSLVTIVSGMGVRGVPCKIFNERQLYKALCSGGEYVLAQDIYVTKVEESARFRGALDGGGYTIYIEDILSSSLIETNDGIIRNLNIEYKDIEATISTPTSLFLGSNRGEVLGVNISYSNSSLQFNKSADVSLSFSGFAIENSGSIINSAVYIDGDFCSTGEGDAFVSGFVQENLGTISNCSTLEGASVLATEVDVAGIVANNAKSGNVLNCINNCTIRQNNSLSSWSPTVGGIALSNYGAIENCSNRSSLSIISDSEASTSQGIVFLGGISANNYGNVVRSLCFGDIICQSENQMVYAGGITAYSGYYTEDNQMILPSIDNCGVKCNIDVMTNGDRTFVFAGGISGYLYGNMEKCFSLATFTNGYDPERWFVGTALGSAYLQYQIFTSVICIRAVDNYVLNQENAGYQIGSLISGGTIVSQGLDTSNYEIITLEYETQIMQKEVYFSD